eukprot:6214725-Pleurochrysis_carterae.AAC.2
MYARLPCDEVSSRAHGTKLKLSQRPRTGSIAPGLRNATRRLFMAMSTSGSAQGAWQWEAC